MNTTALVGYTGFVGSNIYQNGQFDFVYNSKNIENAYATSPDILVYAGVRSEKFLANNNPEKDLEYIKQAEENIKKIAPKKLVLISTIDVFNRPNMVDEKSEISLENLNAYGRNRRYLELWTQEHYADALIIRLPALFGRNIKKNFIFDFINVIPMMLNQAKFEELCAKERELKKYYRLQNNGFYKACFSEDERTMLQEKFRSLGFTALNFTDSRSVYQFYTLQRLWKDINIALNSGILLWHAATEPLSASEIYCFLTGKDFNNELNSIPAKYDFKTLYAEKFGGTDGYICNKHDILTQIQEFVNKMR